MRYDLAPGMEDQATDEAVPCRLGECSQPPEVLGADGSTALDLDTEDASVPTLDDQVDLATGVCAEVTEP